MNRLLLFLSRLLPREDREVVLGDICESGLTTHEAFLDLLGLLIRRTVDPFGHWRAWVCLVVAPLLSLLLIGVSVSLAELVCRHIHHGDLSLLIVLERLRLSILLIVVSISAAMAALRVARAAAIFLLIAAIVPAIVCCCHFQVAGTPRICVFLFLPPILFGAWFGYRVQRSFRILGTAAALVFVCVLGRAGLSEPWMLLNGILLVSPALYCSIALPSEKQHA